MTDHPPLAKRLESLCFLVVCKDKPDAAPLRHTHLNGHLEHVENNWRRYVTAGPIREPGEEPLVGSVFLVLAESLEDAKALMNGDPYFTCGMYQSVEYKEFTNSIGLFMGGKIWDSKAAIQGRAAGGPRLEGS